MCTGLSIDNVGVKGHRISGDTTGSRFETGDFDKEKLGGATVERLISYGDLFAGLADVAVQFKASHAQCDGSVHNDSVAGNCALGKRSRA